MRMQAMLVVLGIWGLVGVACDAGPWDAPPNSEIVDIEDIQVSWTGCSIDQTTGELQNPGCEQSPPVIFRLDALVRNETTLSPLNNIRIWYTSGYKNIYLLPQEVLEAVTTPESPRWADVAGDGEIFAEFAGTFEGDYRPTYYEGWTDNQGVSTVWIWIDSMPLDETGKAKESGIIVSIGAETEIVSLTAAG